MTATMTKQDKILKAFADEIAALNLGVTANTSKISGMYDSNGTFVMTLETNPAPVKGNKTTIEALKAAGYAVDVYAMSSRRGESHKRYFVAWTHRKVEPDKKESHKGIVDTIFGKVRLPRGYYGPNENGYYINNHGVEYTIVEYGQGAESVVCLETVYSKHVRTVELEKVN